MRNSKDSNKRILPYGEGSIFFSKSLNRWMGQTSLGKDENGKSIRKTVYGKDLDDVKKKLQKIRANRLDE